MNYYICEECGQKYCGWAVNIICQKCRSVLKKVAWEEFYAGEKEVIKGGK